MELAPMNFVSPTKNIPARYFLTEPNSQESRRVFSVGMNIFHMAHFMHHFSKAKYTIVMGKKKGVNGMHIIAHAEKSKVIIRKTIVIR